MNYLLHPLRTRAEWQQRQEKKCVVTIDNPPMRIKGRPYKNITEDPNFPTFIAFFGIPYATPPVGPLRFQPPQPLRVARLQRRPPLIKAYKTKHASLTCGSGKFEVHENEDCLYLNIYIPKKPEKTSGNLPVLVFIGGEGLQHGSGDIVDVEPDAIIRQNLIFVTVNSRLCLAGFLNMGTADCRGNAGLKDQVQALKWIRANIDRFGGDPYNITLTGHSVGATCVNLHMISPLSEGLFKRAIVKAGGIHCPWGYQGLQGTPRKRLAQGYGMENELRNIFVQALMNEHPLHLIDVARRVSNNLITVQPDRMMINCGPSKEAIPTNAFIPRDVEELMATAKPVPLIAGIVAQEGYRFILGKWDSHGPFRALVQDEQKFVDFLKHSLHWSNGTAIKYKDALRVQYFPADLSRTTTHGIRDRLATLFTDVWFYRFYDNFKIGQPPEPFFVYNFCYIDVNDLFRWTSCGSTLLRIIASSHGDELHYLYSPRYLKGVSRGDSTFKTEMNRVMDHMCSLWGNFCRSGIPTSDIEPEVVWRPHTEDEPCYLNITGELTLKSTMESKRLYEDRWRELTQILNAQSK